MEAREKLMPAYTITIKKGTRVWKEEQAGKDRGQVAQFLRKNNEGIKILRIDQKK